jgi:hypothetical protein
VLIYLIIHFKFGVNKWYSLFILTGAGFNLVNDLMLGQVYIFTVFITLIALIEILKNKQIIPGILLGMIASIKLFPLLFIPIFIIKKKYKISLSLISTFLIINLIVFHFSGESVFLSFLESFSNNYIQKNVADVLPFSIQYQSFEVYKNILIANDSISAVLKNVVEFVSFLWTPIWLLLISIVLFFYRKSDYFIEIGISLVLLFLLITEVGSASYHMLLIIPSLKVIFNTKFNSFQIKLSLLLVWILMGYLPTLISKIGFTNLFICFSRLWLLLSFIVMYCYCLIKHQLYNTSKNLNNKLA